MRSYHNLLVVLLILAVHDSLGKIVSTPKKVKGDPKAQLMNISSQVRSTCKSFNGKLLEKCCKSPIADFFSKKAMLACNGKKNSAALFRQASQYQLNKLTNSLNKVSFKGKASVNKFGKAACLVDCIFTNAELISDGVVDGDALSALLAEKLDETWAEIVTTATSDCITAVEGMTETTSSMEIKVKAKETKVCQLAPALITQCILRSVFLACPEGYTVSSKACAKATDTLTTCDPFESADAVDEEA